MHLNLIAKWLSYSKHSINGSNLCSQGLVCAFSLPFSSVVPVSWEVLLLSRLNGTLVVLIESLGLPLMRSAPSPLESSKFKLHNEEEFHSFRFSQFFESLDQWGQRRIKPLSWCRKLCCCSLFSGIMYFHLLRHRIIL